MTDPWDIAHVVLVQLADQVRKLPPELIQQLYDGSARIEIVPKGGRPASSSSRRAAAKPALDVDLVRADLSKINDRAAANRYVQDLNLAVAGLVGLADALGIPIARKPLKPKAVELIVQWTVGRRADSDAITRPARSQV